MQILNFYVLWDLYRVIPHIKDKHQGMNGGQGDHDSLQGSQVGLLTEFLTLLGL